MIHPTAIIDPEARLGSQVAVGPHVVIEGPVQIGDGCEIQAHAVIKGHVIMGSRNVIGYGAVIGAEPQDFAFRPEVCSAVHIGDGNRIREYCTIHRGAKENTATVVGDGCYLMVGAHLGHNVRLDDRVVIANNSLLGGYVHVEEGVFIGGGCVFHQFMRVGRLAITQGGSKFSKDIPPYTMAAERNSVAGLNIVGLRRAGFSPPQRTEIKEAFALIYRHGLNVTQALAAARERVWGPEAQAFFDFIEAAKKRGCCGFLLQRKNRGGPAEASLES